MQMNIYFESTAWAFFRRAEAAKFQRESEEARATLRGVREHTGALPLPHPTEQNCLLPTVPNAI